MAEQPTPPEAEVQYATASRQQARLAIRHMAMSLFIGGGLVVFFSFYLGADAPANVPPEEAEWWFALDNAFFWCLRIIGLGLILAAAIATSGNPASMLVAVISEAAFALLMVVMTIAWVIEDQVAGGFNILTILLVILGVVAVGNAKQCWELYRAARPPSPWEAGPPPWNQQS